jgi:hypothetical protein
MRDHGLSSVRQAGDLLARLGASQRLLKHTVLVGEAAEIVLERLARLGVPVDAPFVRLGFVLHDAGKILHPSELTAPGHAHEQAGEQLLLREGVAASLARCCVSHATWEVDGTSFEELLVALSDKLWKGKREPALEKKVTENAASLVGLSLWDVFVSLDTRFESVAAGGAARLARSAAPADG